MPDIIYVLTNEAMPGLVKIGRTTDGVEVRLSSLSCHAGVPLPFECHFAAEVDNGVRVESLLHRLFAPDRLNPRREFVRVEPERVVLAISIGNFREITPGVVFADEEEEQALEKVKDRREARGSRLGAIGINPGDLLYFFRNQQVTATVVSDTHVNLNGEPLALSPAAVKVLQSMGGTTESANGWRYWMFEGELLDERRRRLEAEQFGES
jgi:hypothetical protein